MAPPTAVLRSSAAQQLNLIPTSQTTAAGASQLRATKSAFYSSVTLSRKQPSWSSGPSKCRLVVAASSSGPSVLQPQPPRPSPTGSKTLPAAPHASERREVRPVAAAASAAAVASPPDEPKKFVWSGAKPLPFVLSVGVGLALRFLVPVPEGLTTQAWQLLAIFISTITGLVLGPLPVGGWAFVCLTVTVLTKTLPFATAFSAMTNEVIWLIVIAFFFARGFVKTGLGDRVATYFVKWFGKSTLGLAYGLAASEALISPAMPSTTARAGGVFLPIIDALSRSFGSLPNDPSKKKLGSYLLMSQLQIGCNASGMFLTGAAQNLLCVKLAQELGIIIPNIWPTWCKLCFVPGLVGLIVMPLLLFKLYPPELQQTPEAPALAEKKLQEMGPVKQNEWVMVATMLLAVSLWVFGDALGVPSVVAAMIGLSVLLLTGVLTWNDCLSEKAAWDTLAWFAVLIGMSAQLNGMGIVKWIADNVGASLGSATGGWGPSFLKLQGMYFAMHYLFASQTGHVGALYSAFVAMQLAAGVPGAVAAIATTINTNLFGSITHYASGQSAIYFGAGYIDLPDVFKFGALCAAVNIILYISVCSVWWRVNGLL